MQPIKIIIADDRALFAHGISLLLKSDSNIEILDIANDGKELLDALQKIQPDVILLDINMPKLNGLEAARKIRMHYSSMKIIMLSTYNDDHLIQKAIEYDVQGYLVKTTDKEELLLCINEVMNGKRYFPGTIKKKDENTFDKQDNFLKQFNLTKGNLKYSN